MFLKILNVGRVGVKEEKGVFFFNATLKLYTRRALAGNTKESGILPINSQCQP